MTKTLLSVLLVCLLLCAGLFAGQILSENAGYVLVSFAGYKAEMTVVSLVLMTSVSLFLVWLLFRMVLTFLAVGKFSFSWLTGRSDRGHKKHFDFALQSYLKGDFEGAQKALQKLDGSRFEGVDSLLLAKVAEQNNDAALQNDALNKARQFKKSEATANLLLARQQINSGQQDSGVALLSDFHDAEAIELKAQALANVGRWRELQTSLEKWKKTLSKQRYLHWKQATASGVMSEVASKEGANQLVAHWDALSNKQRKEVEMQVAFVSQLLTQNMHTEAEAYLVKFQPKQYHPSLLPLFRELRLKQPVDSRRKLETWLKQDEENTELLSVLAELAYNAGDLPLAEKVLMKVIKLRKAPADLLLLAKIKEAAQDNFQALQLYKQLV